MDSRCLVAHGPADGSRRVDEKGSITHDNSMTEAAADAIRTREAKLKAAKTQEAREAIAKEKTVYRVAALFSGEEAELVKKALTPNPAQRILAFCREWEKRSSEVAQAAHEDGKGKRKKPPARSGESPNG